jgi:hypothetical protein
MNEGILFAIWLNDNCNILYNCYHCFINDRLYYIDSLSDLTDLYDIFKISKYYKDSVI